MQLLDVAFVELDLGEGGGDLRIRRGRAGLPPFGYKQADFLKLLKFSYRHSRNPRASGKDKQAGAKPSQADRFNQ